MCKAFKNIIVLILFSGFLLSCQKEKVDKPVSYNEFSSVVGPEGKVLHFFKNSSNLPDSLFPVLNISPNTFDDTATIRVYYEKILTGNIPEQLTSISENNYMWYFKSTKPLLKSMHLTIPFQNPDAYLLLDNYKYLFKLYRIIPGKNTRELLNWEVVPLAQLDTAGNFFTLEVDSFNYGYCVFFEEVYFLHTYVLSVKGFINDIIRESTMGKLYVRIDKTTNYNGNFILKGKWSSFYIVSKSKNIDYLIGFQFEGNSPGTYKSDKSLVQYSYYNYDISTEVKRWKYSFDNTLYSEIYISKYGEMGESVEGNIKAELADEYNNIIDIEMDFILTRAR